jgi:hypothetical protein
MTTVSRKDVRYKLAELLEPHLLSANKVYPYKPPQLEGDPAVMILSAGTERQSDTVQGFGAWYFFEIHNLVLYASSVDGWTHQDAEDMLDDLAYQVDDFMDTKSNRKSTPWKGITYAGRSVISNASIGGIEYQDEIIPIKVLIP